MNTLFILASSSPRRQEILSQVDFPFEVHATKIDETYPPNASPEKLVQRFALEKASSVAIKFPEKIIIGADTVVVLKGEILGKPRDEADACKMLQQLSGETHTVFTGIALIKQHFHSSHTFYEKSDVKFFPLNDEMIHYYITKYKPFDKAGSYGIQDWSACFVESIHGCYYNVVGFPIARFMSYLRSEEFSRKFRVDNWLGKVVD